MSNSAFDPLNPFHLDRAKYLEIARTQGLSAAITALHLDSELLERETFEGQEGWRPELYEYSKQVREFSRELWAMRPNDLESLNKPGQLG